MGTLLSLLAPTTGMLLELEREEYHWGGEGIWQPPPRLLIQALSRHQLHSGPGSPADPGQGGPTKVGLKPREL